MQFNETKVQFKDEHEQIKLADLNVGESLMFFWVNQKTINSQDYGDFELWQGLKVDMSQTDDESFVKTSVPVSFAANTMVRNLVGSNKVVTDRLYRIEAKWKKGDKFNGGKVAKGHGYDFFDQHIKPELAAALKKHYRETLTTSHPETSVNEEASNKPQAHKSPRL